MDFPSKLSEQELADYFPAHTNPPESDVFEVGLVLGGTVSAGCFTAGVLDFLIEALDCWTAAKQKESESGATVPNHRVRINVISGASGGGVNGAVFAKVIGHAFAPYRGLGDGRANPLYDLWVNNFDLSGFVSTSDLDDDEPLKSLLNPGPVDRGAQALVDYNGAPLGTLGTPAVRDYVPDKLTLFLTLSNLRGVPYCIELGSERLVQNFVDHADFVRFGVATRAGGISLRPDEFGVDENGAGAQYIGWTPVAEFGKASGAFPVGFPARELSRPALHYRYRAFADALTGTVRPLQPAWQAMATDGYLPEHYRFLAVDGGATNNQPVELARTFLAGHLGRNPREGDAANRCVVLVDPFADAARLGPEAFEGPFAVLLSLAKMWVDQARFATADIALASDEKIFSRFMITPYRRDATGEHTGGRAIASAGFGAAMGFIHPAFRHHDFMLGRRVCQNFLREEFTLHSANGLFSDWRGASYASALKNSKGELPIIPLVGAAAQMVTVPDWPSGVLNFDAVRDAFAERGKAVVKAALRDMITTQFSRALIPRLVWAWKGDEAISSLMKVFKKEVDRWGL